MNKLPQTFLVLLLAVSLHQCMPSQAGIIQRKGSQQDMKQRMKTKKDASTLSSRFDCLPAEYKLTDVVSYRERRKGTDEHITIENALISLKAECKDGKLIDGKGREIRFFKFACFGNPPIDYEEIAQEEREELNRLQKIYTVIVLECNPHAS
jgi:hypothetical protein